MNADLWAKTHTYDDVKRLIYQTVHRFYKRYGGDLQELQAQANLIFLESYESHDPEKAQFSTWLVFTLWKRLQGNLRRDLRHRELAPTVALGNITMPDRTHFDLDQFMDELSEDARTVASLVLDLPMDIRLSLETRKQRKGWDRQTPCENIKGALVEFLWDLGWTTQRIGESFREIGLALMDRS